jgi:hypothetical protein
MSTKKVVTIEQTGKIYKGQILFASLGIVLFPFLAISGVISGPTALTLILLCLVWLVAAKLMAWWEHG